MTGQNIELTFGYRDEFNRQPVAKRIIRLLKSDLPVSPLVIDGGWGSGKSEFCHKLINLIEAPDESGGEPAIRAVFVDAFKADHADAPLMTLVTAVLSVIPEKDREPIKNKVMPMLRFGLKTGGKAMVSWVLRQDAAEVVKDYEGAIKQASDGVIDQLVEDMIEEHEKSSQSLKALQEGLEMLAKDAPVVVFVDELDRCRPDFAVGMLEVIKHVFEVENVKFVLVTNVQQLEAAIAHRYGAVDADKYLGKFMGFRFALPQVIELNRSRKGNAVSIRHYYNLKTRSEYLKGASSIEGAEPVKIIEGFIRRHNLSLRDVEKLVRNLEAYQVMTDNELNKNMVAGYVIQIVVGVCLFSFFPSATQTLASGSLDMPELSKALGVGNLKVEPKTHPSIETVMLKMLSIQSRHINQMSNDALDEGERWVIEVFDDYYRGAAFPPDSDERTGPLMATIRIMGLAQND